MIMATLLLTRKDVVDLLTIDDCIAGVEQALRLHGEGKAPRPGILGTHVQNGGFHIKAGVLEYARAYFVAKINANFPGNPGRNGLPMIQGIIAVSDAADGTLLALIDSSELTIIRTGAATAVAAKYLAAADASTATICGCGNQGKISLVSLMRVRKLKTVYAFDIDETRVRRLGSDFASQLNVIPVHKEQLAAALKSSKIVVTCTPSKQPFIAAKDIAPGTFIAAIGADSEEKQELFSDLLVASKIVADVAQQSATIGELHHAIDEKKLTIAAVHSELGMIVAGKKPGRECEDEIIVFDSTGMALQDVAAASIVYESALARQIGTKFNFDESSKNNLTAEHLKNARRINVLRSWFPFR
jgi:alanine dehydrogenase